MNELLKTLDRRGTDCLKWDNVSDPDMLSMWVADMEYETAPKVKEAIIERAKHGIYGYSIPSDDYTKVVCGWMERRFDWKIAEDEIVSSPGNVAALKMSIQCFTEPGEAILIQTPCYYMFQKSISMNHRRIVSNPLKKNGDLYEMDLADFEKKVVENHIRVFIFENPHNPVGRVYTQEELEKLGELCLKHHLLVISDEVHSDFVFEGRHIPFTKAVPKMLDHTIMLTGPNKTFNLAGLKCSNVIIHNQELRDKYIDFTEACGVLSANTFALVACRAAYLYGDSYVDQLCGEIKAHVDFLDAYLKEAFPIMKLVPPQGTYLVWVDVTEFGMTDEELHRFLYEDAKVWVDEGYMFGENGSGYIRLNLACPREQIREAVDRIKAAFEKRRNTV